MSGNGLTEMCWGVTQTGVGPSQVIPALDTVQEYCMGHIGGMFLTHSGTILFAGMPRDISVKSNPLFEQFFVANTTVNRALN